MFQPNLSAFLAQWKVLLLTFGKNVKLQIARLSTPPAHFQVISRHSLQFSSHFFLNALFSQINLATEPPRGMEKLAWE